MPSAPPVMRMILDFKEGYWANWAWGFLGGGGGGGGLLLLLLLLSGAEEDMMVGWS